MEFWIPHPDLLIWFVGVHASSIPTTTLTLLQVPNLPFAYPGPTLHPPIFPRIPFTPPYLHSITKQWNSWPCPLPLHVLLITTLLNTLQERRIRFVDDIRLVFFSVHFLLSRKIMKDLQSCSGLDMSRVASVLRSVIPVWATPVHMLHSKSSVRRGSWYHVIVLVHNVTTQAKQIELKCKTDKAVRSFRLYPHLYHHALLHAGGHGISFYRYLWSDWIVIFVLGARLTRMFNNLQIEWIGYEIILILGIFDSPRYPQSRRLRIPNLSRHLPSNDFHQQVVSPPNQPRPV